MIPLQTPRYKLTMILVTILEPLSTNKCTLKNSFNIATEIVEQDPLNFIGSLDIDSLFTNIPLEKTVEI